MRMRRLLTSHISYVMFVSAALSAKADDLLLSFPADQPVGVVSVAASPEEFGPLQVYGRELVTIGKAQGNVLVESGDFVGVRVGPACFNDLKWLEALPADAFKFLQFSEVRVSREVLQRIVSQSGLILLEFTGCYFEADCFQDVASLPQLRQLRIESSVLPESGYARWARRLPQLEKLFAFPRPTLSDLEALADHPNLAWTTISIDSEPNKMLEACGRLPALRDLTVISSPEAEPIIPKTFSDLSNLESLSWFYGSLDGRALKFIGSSQNLQKLRLLQVKVDDDLLQGLATLDCLKELSLANMDATPFTTDQLIETLAGLPNLKKWPKLRGVSLSGMNQIVHAQQIEQLTIAGTIDVALTELESIGRLQNLTHLELQNIDITDGWLQCLSSLQKLEYLNLFDTEVVGHGLEHLNGLSSLQRLDIFYTYIDDRKPTPSLAALKELSNLRHLQIGGHFSPEDLAPLSELKQLRSLRLWGGGFSNDSTARTLGELTNLTQLTLSDNCVISDKGAEALARLPQLKRVAVCGFLTKTGVNRLASMASVERLSVATSLLTEQEEHELRKVSQIQTILVKPYSGDQVVYEEGAMQLLDSSLKKSVKGLDGLLRRGLGTALGRTQLDSLEGLAATEIVDFAPDSSVDLQSLSGKVVLIEFWGSWCGPCRRLTTALQELYESQHQNGFEIIGVHTATQADRMSEYLTQQNIPWTNIVDHSGDIAEAYCVPHYPSLFLIDRRGVLRVALVHPAGLADAVASLLDE